MRKMSLDLAIWLLRTCTAGPHADAVTGDLLERLVEGRSMFWLWRQVASALVVGTWRDARDHAAAVLLGSAAGWVFLWFFVSFVAVQIVEIDRLLFTTGVVGTYSRWNRWHVFAPWVVLGLGLLKAGWLVARTARVSSMAAVLAFAASVAVVLAGLLVLDPGAARAPQPGVPLWFPVVFWLLGPFSCIVLGGLLGRVEPDQRPS